MNIPDLSIVVIAAAIIAVLFVSSRLVMKYYGRKKTREAVISAMDKPPSDKRENELDSIFRYYASVPVENQCADDITWDDLDMDEVFNRINTCESSAGEEYLYALLHRRPGKEEEADFRRLTRLLSEDKELRTEVCTALHDLGIENYNGAAEKCFGSGFDFVKIWHKAVYVFLPFMPFAAALLPAVLKLPLLAMLLFVAGIVADMVIYYATLHKVESCMGILRYLCGVLYCGSSLGRLSERDPVFAGLKELFRPFSKTASRIRKMSASNSGNELADAAESYLRLLTFREMRCYSGIRKVISDNRDTLRKLYGCVGMLDSVCAVLNFRGSLAVWCEPEFVTERQISVSGLVHPLIKDPVSNSFEMTGNILVTGSNASGKSSFIKAMAINAILAQSIFTCTAESFSMKRCLVVTSMAVRDDIIGGDSYFVAEIKSMRRIYKAAEREYCFCIIDEILKGTNTTERIAASVSVLTALAETESLCVAATHDTELTFMLPELYRNVHFSEKIEDDAVIFDYKIKEGAAVTRNAIKLLKINGFPSKITDRAEALAQELAGEKVP